LGRFGDDHCRSGPLLPGLLHTTPEDDVRILAALPPGPNKVNSTPLARRLGQEARSAMPLPMTGRLSSRNRRATERAFIKRVECQPSNPQLLPGGPTARRWSGAAVPSCSASEPDSPQGSMREPRILIPELHAATWAYLKRCRPRLVMGRARQAVISTDRTTIHLGRAGHDNLLPCIPPILLLLALRT
jgi:hypothetical protein